MVWSLNTYTHLSSTQTWVAKAIKSFWLFTYQFYYLKLSSVETEISIFCVFIKCVCQLVCPTFVNLSKTFTLVIIYFYCIYLCKIDFAYYTSKNNLNSNYPNIFKHSTRLWPKSIQSKLTLFYRITKYILSMPYLFLTWNLYYTRFLWV